MTYSLYIAVFSGVAVSAFIAGRYFERWYLCYAYRRDIKRWRELMQQRLNDWRADAVK